MCCFSAKHATLRKKNKDCLAQNQDNVSEWGDMSITDNLGSLNDIISFKWRQYLSEKKIMPSVLGNNIQII
jgi:hypothetical protein